MTITAALTLFASMVLLALLPGPGILVVVSRALSGGFRNGLATSVGIVAGDFVFIILSVFGLASLAQSMGDLFVWVRYAGAAYLIYLGLSVLRSTQPLVSSNVAETNQSPVSRSKLGRYSLDFMAGLLTTLSNPKAILFYLSFFPAFLDLSSVNISDLILILVITAFAVGGTMVAYAYLSIKARHVIADNNQGKWLSRVSCALLVGSGLFLMIRSA